MTADPLQLLLAVVLSLLVGLLMGIIGGGGSFVYLLLLLVVGGLPARLAVGTGVVLGVVCSLAATWRHLRRGAVRWRPAGMLMAAAVPAALVGAALTRVVLDQVLLWLVVGAMVVFGLLPLVAAGRGEPPPESTDPDPTDADRTDTEATGADPASPDPAPAPVGTVTVATAAPETGPRRGLAWLRVPTASVLGVGTGAFGIAGGAPLASYLTGLERLPAVPAVGTAMMVVTVTTGAAATMHIGLGQISWEWVATLSAGAVIGAYAGAALLARIPQRPLMIGLGVLSLLTSIGLVIQR